MMAADECFISVYGTLRRHPWFDLSEYGMNGHELFNAYSESLGWGSTGGERPETLLWALNDAGWDWADSRRDVGGHLLWVQTTLTPLAQLSIFPAAQLCLCMEKSLSRVGVPDISGFQAIIPLCKSAARSSDGLQEVVSTSGRPTSCDLEIEIDGGDDPTCLRRFEDIMDELSGSRLQQGFTVRDAVVSNASPWLLMEPPEMTRIGWLGESSGRILIRAQTGELSLDLTGHLVNRIARACRSAGVKSSIMVTVMSLSSHSLTA